MAKDKGGKSAKKSKKSAPEPEPKKKGGKGSTDSGAFGRPSEAPATGGDGWTLADKANIGKLMLFNPLREDTATIASRKNEVVDVIVADVVVLNEKKPEKSELHEGVYVFGKWVQGSLRGFIGDRKVLGRLEQDSEKSQGDRPAWVLTDADDDDVKVAQAYIAAANPFGGSKSKDKGKKKK